MTERDIKLLCKLVLENSRKPLTNEEKEILKYGIDKAETIDDLFLVALAKILI